jgi:acyl-CoA synthetase (AMP-forming)/AMP-acid ligase II
VTARGCEAHLPAGVRAGDVDLVFKRSLPAAWASVWARAPSAPALLDCEHGWITATQLDHASRRIAGRLQAAGLAPGDRMLFSAEPSVELVIAHVAALRSGIVVVPANTAYRQREIAHIVGDSRPRAALVDRPGVDRVHVGHHRQPEGRRALTRKPARRDRVGVPRMALERR